MIFPQKLLPGSTIGLVCPSSPVTPERLAECIRVIASLGYRVKVSDNCTSRLGGYMAGSGEERARQLNAMFADPEVCAVFCVRGGDGGTRLPEFLDLDLIRRNPKIFVGYSDITTLHLLLNQECGLVTFHGPMVSSNMVDAFDDDTARSFFDCINAEDDYIFRNPPEEALLVMKDGHAEAPVIGGNLSLLAAAVGTPYEPKTEGRILFIEEVEEPVTKIEKWMYQLRNAGLLKKCSGLLLGQFTSITNEFDPEFTAYDCIRDAIAGLDFPVLYNLQSGHGPKIMTIPFGAVCEMDTGSRSLVFHCHRSPKGGADR